MLVAGAAAARVLRGMGKKGGRRGLRKEEGRGEREGSRCRSRWGVGSVAVVPTTRVALEQGSSGVLSASLAEAAGEQRR